MDRQYRVSYRCPGCRSPLIWSLTNGKAGATAQITCAQNPVASRLDWDPKASSFCFWTGVAIRRRDGEVELFEDDGYTRIRPVWNEC